MGGLPPCFVVLHRRSRMPTFAAAAHQADDSRLPVVEGITVRITEGADAATVGAQVQSVLAVQLGGAWGLRHHGGAWVDVTPPSEAPPPPLDRTWDAVRAL